MYLFVGFLLLEGKFFKNQESLETNIKMPTYLFPMSRVFEDLPAVNSVCARVTV